MGSQQTVSVTSTRAMLDAAAHKGLDCKAFLAEHRFSESLLKDKNARVPGEVVQRLWPLLMSATQEPALHLLAASLLPFGAYQVIDYLVSTARNVEAGMVQLSRYFRLINNGVELPVLRLQELRGIGFNKKDASPQFSSVYVEYTFAVTLEHFRGLSQQPLNPTTVHFIGPEPSHIDACRALFACDVHYGQSANRLLFSDSSWNQAHKSPNLGMSLVLESHAKLLIQEVEVGSTIRGQLSRMMQETLSQGEPRLEDFASQMAMSPRTLQRKLKAESVSFRELIDQVRQRMARVYLSNESIALCEVAYLLGFSEQSTFQRAFKRWTGHTPGGWRNTQQFSTAA